MGDDHYDIVSAYQKSMRGSDPDAALHYLACLLEAGDLPSACRRLMVCACEDVGLGLSATIPIVKAAVDIANMVGLPEARLPLADAVNPGGYQSQIQLRPRCHQRGYGGCAGRAHRPGAPTVAKQAL